MIAGKPPSPTTIRANSVQRSKTDKSNAPTSDRIIMGCQQSKTTRIINTSSHNSLDKKKPKTKKNGSYENHGNSGGGVTLTTKTFKAVGDPHSILHTTPTKPPQRPSSSTLLQQQQESSFPASLLADYDIVKQIGEGPASRIFLVRPKQKKTQRRNNNDHRRVPNNEGVDEEAGCSSSACSSTEPDLSEDEALLTTTRPRREAAVVVDDDNGHYCNQFLVLQQLNVSHLSHRKRRRMVKEIRSIQETVDHPHSTFVVKTLYAGGRHHKRSQKYPLFFCSLITDPHPQSYGSTMYMTTKTTTRRRRTTKLDHFSWPWSRTCARVVICDSTHLVRKKWHEIF
jgi:hypothetical protein